MAAVTVLLGWSSAAGAQTTATLAGQIRDPQGAVIPGAAISIRHSATNVVTRVTATASGVYLAVSLPPGQHVVGLQRGEGADLDRAGGLALGVALDVLAVVVHRRKEDLEVID